jgi:hypothetical protein
MAHASGYSDLSDSGKLAFPSNSQHRNSLFLAQVRLIHGDGPNRPVGGSLFQTLRVFSFGFVCKTVQGRIESALISLAA